MDSPSNRPKVGIDLAPAAMRARAPGTARLVEEQARALLHMDVPWDWVPVLTRADNPLADIAARCHPIVARSRRFSVYTSFELGRIWRRAGCSLGFSTAFFAPVSGPPVVANYFDANYYEDVDDWHRRRNAGRHLLTGALLRHSVRRSRALFILSDYGRRRMAGLFPRHAHKFIVTPCGVTPPGPIPAQPPAWAPAQPFFLYVGSFSDNKNQRTLLEAWRLFQQRHADAPALALLGPCPPAYRDEIIAPRIRALPRPDAVRAPGFVPENELHWAYANALAYLQPSRAEGFGMPVLEAMRRGLPVACSNSTSLPETAGGAALLFDALNPREIEGVLTLLWNDPARRETMAGAGRDRAALFTWEKNAKIVAETILALYQQGRRTAPRRTPT